MSKQQTGPMAARFATAVAAAGISLSATALAQQPGPLSQPPPPTAAMAAQVDAADPRLREQQASLLACENRMRSLEAEIQTRDAEIAMLTARLDASNQNASRLSARITALRAQLTASEGGTLTAADARKQAEGDAEQLRHLVQQGQGVNNPELWRQVREAENALHRSQFMLARADSARTVYRVRPGDTLAQVGLMFYGDADQWSQIYDANRHVINDPTRLMPGLSLVIP